MEDGRGLAMMRRLGRVLATMATVGAMGLGLALVAPGAPAQAATRPTADSTGVAPGRTLTPMAGGTVATGSTTIADRVIQGDVLFTGSALTLRNVRVTGEAIVRGDNVVVEDSEFGALAISGSSNVQVRRVEVFGSAGRDGMHVTSDTRRVRNVLVEDSWIHNPQVTATSHYDGIQVRGVDGLTLRRLAIELGPWVPQHNAALFLEAANGGNAGVTVEDSWLSGGGYALYSFASDVRVRGTTFSDGRWGHLYPASQGAGVVEFAGNRDAAGTALGMRLTGTSFQIAPVDPVDRARKTNFVEALYADFVGRAPTNEEVLTWVTRLDVGASRYQVATALSRTDTWIRSVVTRYYRDTLGREPDAAGLAGWVRAAQSGTPIASIASCFYGSDEYLAVIARGDRTAWLTDLYDKLLFRSPDGVGLSAWLRALDRGTTRADIALGFYQADETLRLRVESLYASLLGRAADPTGLAGWSRVVAAEGDLSLAAALASSEEYWNRAQNR